MSGQHMLVMCPVALRNDSPVKQSVNMMAAGVEVMSKTGPYINHKHMGEISWAPNPYHHVNCYFARCPIMYICQYQFPQHHKSAKPNSAHIELHVTDMI